MYWVLILGVVASFPSIELVQVGIDLKRNIEMFMSHHDDYTNRSQTTVEFKMFL